jgi:hypothetical protein
MRHKSTVSLKIHDLSLLLLSYYAYANNPEELGECGDGGDYKKFCSSIDSQSEIWLTPEQLYNLVWYFKQAVLERQKFYKCVMPRNYQKMMASLKRQNPELFTLDSDGEILMKDTKDIIKI